MPSHRYLFVVLALSTGGPHLTSGVVDRRRPLCPHPHVTVYNGKGSPDAAANFTCK